MKRLDENLRIAEIMLEMLEKGPMRWTLLMKMVVKESPSPWKVQVTITWFLDNGYIERPERGVYSITEKGRALLKSI